MHLSTRLRKTIIFPDFKIWRKVYQNGKKEGNHVKDFKMPKWRKGDPHHIYYLVFCDGASHAIENQLSSFADLAHGIAGCIMLPPVLRYTQNWNPKAQQKVILIFNEVLGWQETNAADAVARFVGFLRLSSTLYEMGITDETWIEDIAERKLAVGRSQLPTKEEIMVVLNTVR